MKLLIIIRAECGCIYGYQHACMTSRSDYLLEIIRFNLLVVCLQLNWCCWISYLAEDSMSMLQDQEVERKAGGKEVIINRSKGDKLQSMETESGGGGSDGMVVRGDSRDEQGRKKMDKVEIPVEIPKTRNPDTLRYVERKLTDKGLHRMERHPVDGLPLARGPPKSGHGGKFTWEGPADETENMLDPLPPALDPHDPNYVDDEEEEKAAAEAAAEEGGGGRQVLVGQVEVAKVAEEGVARIDVQPPLLSSAILGTTHQQQQQDS